MVEEFCPQLRHPDFNTLDFLQVDFDKRYHKSDPPKNMIVKGVICLHFGVKMSFFIISAISSTVW
jgi:hypothetical protein